MFLPRYLEPGYFIPIAGNLAECQELPISPTEVNEFCLETNLRGNGCHEPGIVSPEPEEIPGGLSFTRSRFFRCQETKEVYEGYGSRRFRGIEVQARKWLRGLDAATSLADLGAIRGNRLEALRCDRAGQYNIRVNDCWRICFSWRECNAHGVEIIDYH